jgi:phenylalanyl-tRNA synthetase beta chain
MRLPVEWITEYAPVSASAAEIAHALTMAGLEVEASEETEQGTVLDIKVTPNRGDCLSVIGVARELAAVSGVEMRPGPVTPASEDEPPDAATYTGVEVENTDLCPRYAARIIEGVQAVETPAWMQARLSAAGMRPISAIVDVTNYVMLETGQPLHAFDYDTLKQRRIVVRTARAGERLVTLDGVDRALDEDALVIADAERPVALAGIMGGADTEITEHTSTILLESAHFDWKSIRRTSKRLGLTTEASYRFERVVDPEGVVAAADRACALMAELGIGRPVCGVVDVYPRPAARLQLQLRPSAVSRLLGYDVGVNEIETALQRLGFGVKATGEAALLVTVPSWRPDILREVDLIEEVGRVLGYERIPERLPRGVTTQGRDTDLGRFLDELRDRLIGAGLQEVVGHSLMAPSPFDDAATSASRIPIRTALSEELSGLRRSLVPGLLDVLDRNARRSQGPLAFFEVGNVFVARSASEHDERTHVAGVVCGSLVRRSWHAVPRHDTPWHVVRGIADMILEALGLDGDVSMGSDVRLHPGRQGVIGVNGHPVGRLGELHPDLAGRLHVRERVGVFEMDCRALMACCASRRPFRPLSPYPAIVRDLAPRVPVSVTYAEVRDAVRDAGGALLEDVVLIDVYAGDRLPEGVRSLTLSLTLRSTGRTLTDEEAENVLEAIRSRLRDGFGASFPAA